MLPLLLALTAAATPPPPHGPPPCEAAFHDAVRPPGAPPPPPLAPIVRWTWDADDSGTLDADERDALRADQEIRCEALAALLADVDANGDGRLDDAERRTLHARVGGPPPRPPGPPPGPPPRPGATPPPLLHAFDLDRDGSLSAEERDEARAVVIDRFRNGLPPIPHEEVR